MKMKLVLVNKLYAPELAGGAETIARSLAESHRRRGYDVTVVTTTAGDTLVRDEVGGVPVVRLPLRNFFWHHEAGRRNALARAAWHVRDAQNHAMARAFSDVIAELDPDVISFHNLAGFSASVWGAARARRTPALQVLHDYYHLCPRSQLYAHGQRCERRCTDCALFRLGRRSASNQLQAVVGVSQAVLDAHVTRGLFGATPVRTVIHNAVAPVGTPRSGAEGPARVFGYLGTLGDFKGVEPLLEAFTAALRCEPGLRLRVAGSGEPSFSAALRDRYAHPNLEFLGRVVASEFFRTIDVLIVPSLWDEPLPTVIIEALSAGVPVIGARRGGIPELIAPEENGLLYDPAELGALEGRILRLARDPELRSTLARGCAGSGALSDEDRMAREHERVYERLCGGDGACS